MKNGFIGKRDIITIAAILLIAVTALVLMNIDKQEGNKVVVRVDNEIYGEYDLNSDDLVEISTDYGHNVFVIENGEIYVIGADCPDKICVKTGKKSNTGDIIVCLPHKVVISIEE